MFKKKEEEIIVSVAKLKRAEKHICKEWDLVSCSTTEEGDKTYVELCTYKNLSNGVLYVCLRSGLKKAPKWNGVSSVTLLKKNIANKK